MATTIALGKLRDEMNKLLNDTNQKLADHFGVEVPEVKEQRGRNDADHKFTYAMEKIVRQYAALVESGLAKQQLSEEKATSRNTRVSKEKVS